jgi:hypothetical protein
VAKTRSIEIDEATADTLKTRAASAASAFFSGHSGWIRRTIRGHSRVFRAAHRTSPSASAAAVRA